MKLSTIGLLAGAALALVSATAADATVFVSYKLGAGAITPLANGATDATFSGNIGPYQLVAAVGSLGTSPQILASSLTVKKNGTNTTPLWVYVTATNIAGTVGDLTSAFTENTLPSGWTVDEATYYDLGNGDHALTNLLSTELETMLAKQSDVASPGALHGPLSLTHVYEIMPSTTSGQALSTITLSGVTVPEPATWALMLGGFGLAGLSLRSRVAKYKVGYVS
jgi:hypothetical protein